MMVPKTLRTQWRDYPGVHANKVNLAVHLVFVPVFMVGTVMFVTGLCTLSIAAAAAGLLAMAAAMAAQGWGHGKEAVRPAGFASPVNALTRILLEQWVTFPGYVLCLAWGRVVKRSPKGT